MVIKDGYKLTEIGVVPNDWDVKQVGEIFKFKNGLNKEKKYFGRGTPIVNYMDVYNKRGLHTKEIEGRVLVNNSERKAYEVTKGDVLFTRTSETVEEIGIASVILEAPKNMVFSGFLLRGRPKDNSLHHEFTKFCFGTYSFRSQIISKSSYTTRALTNGKALSEAYIAYPNEAEQKAITKVLDDIDSLISNLEDLLCKKMRIKQAAIKQYVEGRSRLQNWKDEWIEVKLGKISEIYSGGTPSTFIERYWDGNIPWMNSGELHLKRVEKVAGSITKIGFENSPARWVPINSVLIGLAGQGKTRGTVAICKIELTTNQSIAAIVPKKSIDPEFLFYHLETRYEELRELSSGGGGRGGLNLSILKSLSLIIPKEKNEQREISTIISQIDFDISNIEKKIDKFKSLKVAMMQQLLTGKIRLL